MVLGPTEMATLGNLEPLSNFFFWNFSAEHEYVRTRGADADNLLMLLREYQPDIVISNRDRRMPSNSPYRRAELGEPGGYHIEVFVQVAPVEAWGEVLAGVPTMTDWLVTHLKAVAVDHQNGVFNTETDVVEQIGGSPPQSLSAFIHATRASFGFAEATSRA